ncbi:MAG: serine hydrolase [Candidatus Cohnella colombiensis]|uniref:Serine hydrolase n=1 Tax=Candidatus Cohnella colombiensis TaxID=3121368 RepID=A0AA95F037_9BACL|nr:MAG: serine hydrolase [Cohnella sp.]
MNNTQFNKLNRYVSEIQKQINATAAATYIIQNDIVVNEWYSGRHDSLASSRIVDAQSQFNVGSVRKTYLAFAISLLIENGNINCLDDEIGQYMNELRNITHGITIRHCLTHTHGLELHEGKLLNSFLPGENWAYTNAGITILIEMVERLTGISLADYISNEVFNPLGLVETGWRTQYHEHLVFNHYNVKDNWVGPNDSPTGNQSNLFVSARELALWGNIHLNNGNIHGEQVFSKYIFERITSHQTPVTLPSHLPRQGLIWWLQSDTPLNQIGNRVPVGSFQILGITGCACLVIPKYKAVAVRMLNQLNNTDGYNYLEDIRQFGNEVIEALQVNSNKV